MGTVSLEGLNKAAVFVALFNRSKPQGLGFLHYNPEELTAEQAQERFGECSEYFDYVDGRVMKVDLSSDELHTGGYNRDNGINAAEDVIDTLRSGGNVTSAEAQHAHAENTRDSAALTKDHLHDEPHVEMIGDILEVNIVAGSAAVELAPKLDDILDEDS